VYEVTRQGCPAYVIVYEVTRQGYPVYAIVYEVIRQDYPAYFIVYEVPRQGYSAYVIDYEVTRQGCPAYEEKIFFRNQPIRNKTGLWDPCLLMDRDKISKVYRGPAIDVSYQVSVHLAKRFQRRRFFKIGQSETRIAYGGHVC
jgi:hypothetical protein